MALPFLAGLAVGGLAVYALNNKSELKKQASNLFKTGKEAVLDISSKTIKPKRRAKATPAKKPTKPKTTAKPRAKNQTSGQAK